ncbi:hypothetical protein GSB9_00012 [Flavobacteriaceae bacterium GSB9]|nr:hypothetical protein GSB9_00012 [Flavobacteriaceae bacterium GSB9]
MNIFLKLKHWQIFLIWILGTIQMFVFVKSDFWFLSFGLYIGIILIWIYSIGNVLNENADLQKRINLWWILYILSLIPQALNFRNIMTQSYNRIETWIIGPSAIIGLIAIVKILIFTARTLKKEESNKEYKMTDLIPEMFYIFSTILGVWFLQPRLNKLMKEK